MEPMSTSKAPWLTDPLMTEGLSTKLQSTLSQCLKLEQIPVTPGIKDTHTLLNTNPAYLCADAWKTGRKVQVNPLG